MDKFSMAMGITLLLNRTALSAMTLAQVAGSPNPQLGPFEQQ